jgi:hypothetical protein
VNKKLKTTAVVATLTMAAFAVGGIGIAKPVKSVDGNVEAEFGGGFSPKALSEEKPAPIASFLWEKVSTRDGFYPPALKKLRVVGDEHVEVDLKSWPVCRLAERDQRLTTGDVRKQCGPSIVGTGRIKGGVIFVGDKLIGFESDLLVTKGPGSTLYAYADLSVPTPALIVIPIEVKKIHRGRFGTEAVASLPKIAGGSGVVTYFRLGFKKGVLHATCPNRHLSARISAIFGGETKTSVKLTRPCAARTGPKRRD